MGKVIDYYDKFSHLAERQSFLSNKHKKQLHKLTQWLQIEHSLRGDTND